MKSEQEERVERKKLLDKYEKLSYQKKFEVLWSALDYMEQYNGRSKYDCIVLALGGQVFYVSGNV